MKEMRQENSLPMPRVEREEAKNFQLALTYSKDLISKHTFDGTILYVSPSIKYLLGYLQHELYKKNILSYCHPNDKNKLIDKFTNFGILKERTRFRMRKKDGDYIWLETNCSKIGEHKELLCISRDVTEQVGIEEETAETQEKYRLLVEHSKDTIGMVTEKGIWTYINGGGQRLFGFTSSKEVVGTSFYDYLSPSDYPILENFLKGERNITFEMSITRSDGDLRKAEIQLIPTVFKSRKVFQVIIRDITGQKKTEERLQNAEKLSILGQLAAGIAHEIRNPLTAIKGFAQFLTEGKTSSYGEVILGELERIDSIVNDLLVLAKPQTTIVESINLVNIIKSVAALLKPQAEELNIVLNESYQTTEIMVKCEPDKIKQVLINIIKNSIEAMPTGGMISITLKKENNFINLSVSDEGIGIPEDRLAKVGEPFFSTKEKGTGLGMMICNKIIKNHGGNLQIKSKEGEGTNVTIFLPME